jgi:GNAT superfamily N-acetyltransferase
VRAPAYSRDLRTLISLFVMSRVLRRDLLLGIGQPVSLDAAAIVSRPGGPPSPPALTEFRERVWHELGPEAQALYEAFGSAWAPFQVDEPHLHVNMIGVRRVAQGRGLARALLEHVHALSEEDPESRGVSLSTEDPANVSLYEYFGYRVIGHATLLGDVQAWGFYRPNLGSGRGDVRTHDQGERS